MSYPAGPPAPPSPPRAGRSTRAIALTVVLALVAGFALVAVAGLVTYRLAGGGDEGDTSASPPVPVSPSPSETGPSPSVPSGLERFYDQQLDWTDCGSNQCTTMTVPLDYAAPSGRTIQISVLRSPATDQDRRVGQLVVNPGGPGGSGVEYAASGDLTWGRTLTRYFDIVGFDPRGVGRSTPLECSTTAQTDEFLAADPSPDDAAEVRRLDQLTRAFGEGCLQRSGDLARHVSTIEVAKDMDVLRAALGERKLDYFGASYGTTIGATYAELFPDRLRRMVLDGAVDPGISDAQAGLDQAGGFQTALSAYLQDCVDRGDCPLGDSVDEGNRNVRAFLDRVDADPLPTGTDRPLTEGLAVYGLFLPLYVKDYWPLLTDALRQAIDGGDGSGLLRLSDEYVQRRNGAYEGNQTEALYAVNCLDATDSTPASEVPGQVGAFEKVAPAFARVFAWGLTTCGSWPIEATEKPLTIDGAGAPPIVVVGTTRDPATPYKWAQGLAEELRSGVLVSRDGDGHTGFRQGNECVDTAIESYLVAGTVPRDGLSC
ncbi:alpha/beta hydrolase fold [Nocardioides scoriae]|uniref:Alpha/beta hydrolase fold n=1 Tax=Nocardioides scoriae TaxID=642780 RepID=A0A1H1UD19_9ACTN|nr:alpha/beta hydrolase [Nocardioides scoriae]SDS69799.1 alpha/beta hydrolase fold [Nocardioides scoriae]